jgi:DNA-binding transcriptional LysR family regulator
MTRHPLAQVDANLFVVLDSLLETSSVADTARRLGVSASAISHSLARIRDLVGDPILVRAGQRMVVTARGRAMAPALRAGLAQVAQVVVTPTPFDPATHAGTLRVAAVDFATNHVLPPLLGAVRREAPGVDVIVSPFEPGSLDALADTLDLVVALHGRASALPSAVLTREPFACVVRKGHPAGAGGLDAAMYAALPHVVVSPVGSPVGSADAALAALGLKRRVALVVPTFAAAAHAVVDSDLVLTGSRREAERTAQFLPLQLLEPPVALRPFHVGVYWHPRSENDPLITWVLDRLRTARASPPRDSAMQEP